MTLNLHSGLVALINEDIPCFTLSFGSKDFTVTTRKPTINDKTSCRKYLQIRYETVKSRYNPNGIACEEIPVFEFADTYASSIEYQIRSIIRKALGIKLPKEPTDNRRIAY